MQNSDGNGLKFRRKKLRFYKTDKSNIMLHGVITTKTAIFREFAEDMYSYWAHLYENVLW